MNNDVIRSGYSDFVAKLFRFIKDETENYLPDDTVIIASPLSLLADFDDIIGVKVMVMCIETDYDFSVAIPADTENKVQFHKAITEFFNLYKLGE